MADFTQWCRAILAPDMWPTSRTRGRAVRRRTEPVATMSPAVPTRGPQSVMTETHADYPLSQLDQLEAESIHIIREVAAEFEKPALMFSGGKDSIVMLRLAEKAFYPAKIPFPLLQVDTGLD